MLNFMTSQKKRQNDASPEESPELVLPVGPADDTALRPLGTATTHLTVY